MMRIWRNGSQLASLPLRKTAGDEVWIPCGKGLPNAGSRLRWR